MEAPLELIFLTENNISLSFYFLNEHFHDPRIEIETISLNCTKFQLWHFILYPKCPNFFQLRSRLDFFWTNRAVSTNICFLHPNHVLPTQLEVKSNLFTLESYFFDSFNLNIVFRWRSPILLLYNVRFVES